MHLKSLFPGIAVLYLVGGATVAAGLPTNSANGSPQEQQSGNPKLTTFSGTVWLNSGRFVLRDELHSLWYQLDDQRRAARFEGKEVRVTGTLDASNTVIHVRNIEEDPIQFSKERIWASLLCSLITLARGNSYKRKHRTEERDGWMEMHGVDKYASCF